jgi:hypothetical protein
MFSKLLAFGAGYMLGSRAGRERYEQIVAIAREAARRLDEYSGDSRLPSAGWWARSRAGARGDDESKV